MGCRQQLSEGGRAVKKASEKAYTDSALSFLLSNLDRQQDSSVLKELTNPSIGTLSFPEDFLLGLPG